jgi:tRNA-specific 2-thiouridylase
MKKKFKVYIGLSGGVDSAVSAALLKKQGYDVTGVFIKVWQPDFLPCNWKEERREAMRVCAFLDIPFFTLDLEKEYKSEVVDYMIDEYSKGRTPNPDVMCNKYVKFGGFFDWAMKNDADYVATGHYAQIKNNNLLKGKDKEKDQTYFLWTLTQKQLSKTLFPVGEFEKSEVRKLAKKFKLPNAEKKDSQGLCFVGKIDMKEFLKHYIKEKPGNILDSHGKIIGKHDGSLLITIGQKLRGTPYFVISKDIKRNTITVSGKNKETFHNTITKLKDINWINQKPKVGKTYEARIRYRGKLYKTKVNPIKLEERPASGQSIVFYEGNTCLGGGIVV